MHREQPTLCQDVYYLQYHSFSQPLYEADIIDLTSTDEWPVF